jgi:hypothetical protein
MIRYLNVTRVLCLQALQLVQLRTKLCGTRADCSNLAFRFLAVSLATVVLPALIHLSRERYF